MSLSADEPPFSALINSSPSGTTVASGSIRGNTMQRAGRLTDRLRRARPSGWSSPLRRPRPRSHRAARCKARNSLRPLAASKARHDDLGRLTRAWPRRVVGEKSDGARDPSRCDGLLDRELEHSRFARVHDRRDCTCRDRDSASRQVKPDERHERHDDGGAGQTEKLRYAKDPPAGTRDQSERDRPAASGGTSRRYRRPVVDRARAPGAVRRPARSSRAFTRPAAARSSKRLPTPDEPLP